MPDIGLEEVSIYRHKGISGSYQQGPPASVQHSGRRLTTAVRLAPIVFFLSYLCFTVFLFAFGPWPWPVADGTKLYVFLIFAHLALLIGYLTAAFGSPLGYYGKWAVMNVIKISLVVSLVLIIPTCMARAGTWIPNVLEGIRNPGAVYGWAVGYYNESKGAIILIEYIRICVGPLVFMALPVTIFYWRYLNWWFRLTGLFCAVWFAAMYVAVGINKALADFIILVPWMIVAGYYSGFLRIKLRRKALIVTLGAGILAFFMTFFTSGQLTRSGSGGRAGYFYMTSMYADQNNFMVRLLPGEAKLGAIAIVNYVTQGYYGLYLSLEQPYVPSFGVGNSMFLLFNAARVMGNPEIQYRPYPMRVEQASGSWSAMQNWSSIYPWLASDVTFPGAILVVFFIGRLFALSWLDTLRGTNPFAVASFAQFIIMLFYFSANNQCVQSGEGFSAFYGCLALWLYSRRRRGKRAHYV